MSFAQETEIILTGVLDTSVFRQEWAKEWIDNKNSYKPDPEVLEKLSVHKNTSCKIFLGTWCSDSRDVLPGFFKVAESTGISFELIGVDRDKNCPLKDCKNWEIMPLPTLIVYENGLEKGRIIETVEKNIETDLLEILNR